MKIQILSILLIISTFSCQSQKNIDDIYTQTQVGILEKYGVPNQIENLSKWKYKTESDGITTQRTIVFCHTGLHITSNHGFTKSPGYWRTLPDGKMSSHCGACKTRKQRIESIHVAQQVYKQIKIEKP